MGSLAVNRDVAQDEWRVSATKTPVLTSRILLEEGGLWFPFFK